MKFVVAMTVVSFLFSVILIGGLTYIGLHFIGKFW